MRDFKEELKELELKKELIEKQIVKVKEDEILSKCIPIETIRNTIYSNEENRDWFIKFSIGFSRWTLYGVKDYEKPLTYPLAYEDNKLVEVQLEKNFKDLFRGD